MNKLDYFRKRGKLVRLDLSDDEIWDRMVRTAHNCVCKECGKLYIDHPLIENIVDNTLGDPTPFLYYICNGMIVKL